MSDWKAAIEAEWNQRHATTSSASLFPLIAQSFGAAEIVAAVNTLLSGRLTMGERVAAFEKQFADFIGASFAVMVNSGSSANLLALAAASNPARAGHLVAGDEVLVPAVCWPTSLWPIVQLGLTPVFVDVDPVTLNCDLADLRRRITPRTRAMMAVHILGNSAPMTELCDILAANRIMLIEDTCESLGSTANGRHLGTIGAFGTFSFYYSHHITTGEGGMVVCKTAEDADLLRCLRSHGWSRSVSNRAQIERENPAVDPRFLFINSGFNFRPTEIQAAFGTEQLKRLPLMNRTRQSNMARLVESLERHPRWRKQLSFPTAAEGTSPAWFGLPCILGDRLMHQRREYLDYLTRSGVENRPLVSGNFLRQPALKLFGLEQDPAGFPGAEVLNERGCFLGLHTEPLTDALIERVCDILLSFS